MEKRYRGQGKRERQELLTQIDVVSERPLALLGLLWLALLIADMTTSLSRPLMILSGILYAIFLVDFLLRLCIAPDPGAYLKKNWLLALSLLVPAVRIVRAISVLRVAGLMNGMTAITMIGSVTRGMHSLNATLRRRGFIYVVILTMLVMLVSAAGIYAFEKGQRGTFHSYGDAVLWSASVLVMSYGGYWPATLAGKILMIGIGVYSFSMFGYITATIGSFFIGLDAKEEDEPPAGSEFRALRQDIRELTAMVAELKATSPRPEPTAEY